MKIGFIGLGRMGAAMATNLVKAGHDVTVFNRNPEKRRALLELGAHEAGGVADACHGEVIVTMLADDTAVADVALAKDGIVESLAKGAIHLSMSTISVALSKQLSEAHARAGQRFVAAPVFGRPEAAAAAKLFIVAAGDAAADGKNMNLARITAAGLLLALLTLQLFVRAGHFPTLLFGLTLAVLLEGGGRYQELDSLLRNEIPFVTRPLLDALGSKTLRIGRQPAAANLVKLSGNFLLAAAIEALGEAIALVDKAGIDRRAYVDLLTSTVFPAPAYKIYGGLIAEGRFQPAAFAAPLGFKDIRLALQAAESLGVPMPLASLLHDRFLRLLAQGGDSLDWSAIGGLAAQDAGAAPTASADGDSRSRAAGDTRAQDRTAIGGSRP